MTSRFLITCGAILFTSLFALVSPEEARACGPGPFTDFNRLIPNKTVMTAQPELLVVLPGNADIEPVNFTLTDDAGETYSVTANRTDLRSSLDRLTSIRPDQPLPSGSYHLAYEGGFIINTDGKYVDLEDELFFEVDAERPFAEELSFGLEWYRHKLPDGTSPWFDSCGGSNLEYHEFHVEIPEMCRSNVGWLYMIVESPNPHGFPPTRRLMKLTDLDTEAHSPATDISKHVFYQQNRTGQLTSCQKFTLRSIDGIESQTRELCAPTYCSEGMTAPTSLDAYTPCDNGEGIENTLRLHSTLCPIAVSSGDCQELSCPEQHTCDAGRCIPDDPCQGSLCLDDEICEGGICYYQDPCENVICQKDWTCQEGHCIPPPDPCEGIVCEGNQTCVNARCVTMEPEQEEPTPSEEPAPATPPDVDPCENVECASHQHCLAGLCIDQKQEKETEDRDESEGCGQVASKPNPSTARWLLLGLLALVCARKKRRRLT